MSNYAKQSRYDVMESQVIKGDVNIYPDCLSLDLKSFPSTCAKKSVLIRQGDYLRPDLFFHRNVGNNNLEDVILWLNDVPSRREMQVASNIQIPSNSDINSYFISNRKLN